MYRTIGRFGVAILCCLTALLVAPASAGADVCAPGSFDAGSGCVPAPPGTYVDQAGAVAAIPCPVGTFQPGSGSTSCLLAPAGFFVDVVGAVAATPCAVGSYQPDGGASACLLAPKGSYVATTGAVAATLCPSGTTTTVVGSTSAAACVPVVVVTVPTSANQCKKNGWQTLTDHTGRPFRNQGDCMSYVATGARNLASG